MKYILMMNCPRKGYELMGAWPKKAVQDHIAFMHTLNKDLREAGELVSAEGLADPRQAVIVRVGKNGEPVTDGIFPESKEFLAGYWIVDVDSEQRAHEIAARASSAPGSDGKPFVIPIEVRQVMSGPPDEFVA
ncbi:MAG TPA: YciI family protein [Candidatus Sulfotelmatobacter sp.]|nr:YciI family protein [Candidatus Sulfotelmatobacter sp.]